MVINYIQVEVRRSPAKDRCGWRKMQTQVGRHFHPSCVSILICVSGASVNGLLFHMSLGEHHIVFHLPSIFINRFVVQSSLRSILTSNERDAAVSSTFFHLHVLMVAHYSVRIGEWRNDPLRAILMSTIHKCRNGFSETKNFIDGNLQCNPYVARCSLCRTSTFTLRGTPIRLYVCICMQTNIRKHECRATSNSTFKSSLSHHVAWIIAFWYVLINGVKGVKNCCRFR